MTILYFLGLIGFIICWIITLIKMFQSEKPLIAIIGVLCSIWAFIWGWMNAGKHGHRKIMLIWTVCVIICMISGALGGLASIISTN